MNFFIPGGPETSHLSQYLSEVARLTEVSILEQLNDFISRGLLTVEKTQPILVREQDSAKITVRHSVILRLKDRDYIESLERQVKELNDLVQKLRSAESEPDSAKGGE